MAVLKLDDFFYGRTITYLAVPRYAYDTTFADRLGKMVIKQQSLRLIVFEGNEDPLQWTK